MKKFLLFCFATLLCSTATWAQFQIAEYDFSAENDDGVTIYYQLSMDILTMKETAHVVAEGQGIVSYSGNVVIPETAINSNDMALPSYDVTGIDGAFDNCTELTSVILSANITAISGNAFSGCSGLTEITILNTTPPSCSTNAFSGVDTETCVLYVPEGSVDTYKETDGWKDFANIKVIGDNGDGGTSGETVTDEISYAGFGSTTGSVTCTGESGTEYAAYYTRDHNGVYNGMYFGLYSGVYYSVTNTKSVGYLRKISFMAHNRSSLGPGSASVYGSNTPFTLSNGSTPVDVSQGTFLGTLDYEEQKNSSTGEIEITGNYKYFVICDDTDRGCYESIDFEWELIGDGDGDEGGLKDGDTFYAETEGLYYKILSVEDKTVEVTFGDGYHDASNTLFMTGTTAYTGSKTIPLSTTYEGETYSVVGIGYHAFFFCQYLESITIPEGIKSVGDAAFRSCYSLSTVTLPESIENLGDSIFFACYGHYFEEVKLPSQTKRIPKHMFHNCLYLATVNIPEELDEIDDYAFMGCSDGLTSLKLPETITNIGEYAFYDCEILKEINIPTQITDIKTYTFAACHALAEITIPEGVTNIGEQAFRDCYSLTEIILPEAMTYISRQAFSGCSKIVKIYSLNPEPPTVQSETTFNGIDSECVLYVPKGSKEDYMDAEYWEDFYDIREIGGNEDADGINGISLDTFNMESIYSTSGQKLNSTVKGVNIVRLTDGTVKKIYVK